MTDGDTISFRDQLRSLSEVAKYRPFLSIGVVALSILAALLEGIGLSFLIPIIEIAQGNLTRSELSGIGQQFLSLYDFLGIPFRLEFAIFGVAILMIVRYLSSFIVEWFMVVLKTDYVRELQTQGFQHALDAQVKYYDEHGSDEILNAIVTQSEYAATVITNLVKLFEQITLSLVYLAIALYIAPKMTVVAGVLLGSILVIMRWIVEGGYTIGDRVATANERIQESVQAGTQGIRDVKLFGLAGEIFEDFERSVDLFYESSVKQGRNNAAMKNVYQMVTAIAIFGLIYASLTFASLSVAELGLFLFAMFRLAPRVSTLNKRSYRVATNLPHLVRTQEFIFGLLDQAEADHGSTSIPSRIEEVAYESVSFSYGSEEILSEISFEIERDEFVAFVGPSGAGKSTIVSLLARLYEPDSGQIKANQTPIDEYPLDEWRCTISMVRQHPFIFNDTLRYNVTVGNRAVSETEMKEVCELAQVTEFIPELPDGFDTQLGDDGVRLSGGQRQRIALARALLDGGDILILDEATSDLDRSLEERIQANLEVADRSRMLIVIAHRLSTVENADRIYTMKDGSIIEVGHHEELVTLDGTYADLYSTQST